MLTLGLSGLFVTEGDEFLPNLKRKFHHDAAACLIEDGRVVLAVEEERLNRVKHTNLFPSRALRACLAERGVSLRDVDCVAYFWEESWLDLLLGLQYLQNPAVPKTNGRELIAKRLEQATGEQYDPARIAFQWHHESHAASVFHDSGFDESLILIMDGNGEKDSCSVYSATASGCRLLRSAPTSKSLGHYYTMATRLIGYGSFDEYKVMGLAPYGDASRFSRVLDDLVEFRNDGEYALDVEALAPRLFGAGYTPRRSNEPFSAAHKDLAAAVQHQLEKIALHILQYWAGLGYHNLCFAGGVAHNSTLNGKILGSGLFDSVFIHPAGHDSGAALGAALLAESNSDAGVRAQARGNRTMLPSAFWGPRIEQGEQAETILRSWSDFVSWEPVEAPAKMAASMLAQGQVIAWAVGASEFGPRALGHRSILADARPKENKDRINKMIKMREGYRPFAPAVLKECVHDYFDIPATDTTYEFMSFVMPVRQEYREILGAVTHVDGTARLQTVDAVSNKQFWEVIRAFADITGMPVLLNTSLNNNAEPIVQSLDDCIVTLITTELDALVLDNHIVRPKRVAKEAILRCRFDVPPVVRLTTTSAYDGNATLTVSSIGFRDLPGSAAEVSATARDVVLGRMNSSDVPESGRRDLAHELWDLWQRRLITVVPHRPEASRS